MGRSGRSRGADAAERVIDARERGFTLVETTIALTILAVGVVAVAALFLSTTQAVGIGKSRNTAVSLASSYVEDARASAYNDVVLTSMPQHSNDPKSPNFFVTSGLFAYDPDEPPEPLVVVPGNSAGMAPGPLAFPSGPITGDVHQYVTWVDDPAAPGIQNFKRVTIVAMFTTAPRSPVRQVKLITLVSP